MANIQRYDSELNEWFRDDEFPGEIPLSDAKDIVKVMKRMQPGIKRKVSGK